MTLLGGKESRNFKISFEEGDRGTYDGDWKDGKVILPNIEHYSL
jgi:hypothetical protein